MAEVGILRDEKEHLETRKERLGSKFAELDERPGQWVTQRKKELNDALRQVRTKYEPRKEGNETMYEHLRGSLDELGREEKNGKPFDKMGQVQSERRRLESKIDTVESLLQTVSAVESLAAKYEDVPNSVLERPLGRTDEMHYYADGGDTPDLIVWYYVKSDNVVFATDAWTNDDVAVFDGWIRVAEDIMSDTDTSRLEFTPPDGPVREHFIESGFEVDVDDERVLYHEVS